MPSYVDIANAAAAKMGSDVRLISPDDDKVMARRIAAAWDMQRRAAIRDGAWNFAMRTVALPQVADRVISPPFNAAYRLPADSVRLVEMLSSHVRGDYQLEGGFILCRGSGPLTIRYLADEPEPSAWDDTFADAFAARLAWKLGKANGGTSYSEAQGEREYRMILADAKRVDALENPPVEQAESAWVEARFTGSATHGYAPRGYPCDPPVFLA